MCIFALQMNTMKIKINKEKRERELVIFCSRCTKRHTSKECSLTVIEVFLVCEGNHAIDKFLYFPRLKCVYQWEHGG